MKRKKQPKRFLPGIPTWMWQELEQREFKRKVLVIGYFGFSFGVLVTVIIAR
jgi:hypothetical protein